MSKNDSSKKMNRPRISIGLPVYNCEQFIRKKLDSILSQTFTDFELIISDNGSTDSTPLICNEYSKKDKRIRYIHHNKNRKVFWNYYFVLQEAKYDFFAWTAVDDMWSKDFLEKNVKILESNQHVVGSISNMEHYGPILKEFKSNTNDSMLRKLYKKIRRQFKPVLTVYPITGSYEEKIRTCLKNRNYLCLYCVFRTDKLRKSVIIPDFYTEKEPGVILRILKFGDIHVIKKPLIVWYTGGMSSDRINLYQQNELVLSDFLTLEFPFTFWFIKHFGIKFFLKNFDQLFLMNFVAMVGILVEVIRFLRRPKIRKKQSLS